MRIISCYIPLGDDDQFLKLCQGEKMNEHAMMNVDQLVEKAGRVLVREYDPVEAGHFIHAATMP